MPTKQYFKGVGVTLLAVLCFCHAANSQPWNPSHKVGTSTGKFHFTYAQTPDQLVEIFPAGIPNTGLTYQWEQSQEPTTGFTGISGATQSTYTFSASLANTTYYRRRTDNSSIDAFIYSNVIKISVVSVNWEDINYIREHDVLTTGITQATAVDQLAIGPKLQTTTYLDGLGRPVQKISRETATPAIPTDPWGDMVQVSQYDAYGRQPFDYLPFTTVSQPGKFKTTPVVEQPQYYQNNYGELYAGFSITFDNSPLNRVLTMKKPGTSWHAGPGISSGYEVNTSVESVQRFVVDYVQGGAPIHYGSYAPNTLYKTVSIDENGKKVIEYTNISGQMVLRKVQLDDNPTAAHTGWICTYNVFDDFGQLRYQIQPEAVKYLDNNFWSFGGANGQTILAEQVIQYYYDDKGRTTWKKTPGAQPLKMLYDARDRVVFMQDGNQAALATPQWTTSIYDELDRVVISTLYNSSATIPALQASINSAPVSNTITINNPGTVAVTAATHLNPLTSANLNNTSVTTVLGYQFYDNYSFNAVKTFNTNYTNLSAYSTSDPNVQVIAKTLRTTSMATGSMTRVLETSVFITSTIYFDERGALIQMLEDNIKSGTDINTFQYHFDGRVISVCNDHTVPNTGYTNYKTLTKHLFDKLGRTTSIQKQYGANALKTVSSYEYDDAGRLKKKILDPGYTGGGNSQLESLSYSYNLQGQITGINKDYALKNPANYNKWAHYFGLYIGFDNKDLVFAGANLTGQVTGLLWNTQGDDAQRKFDYTYDNAGRLTKADFKEKQHTGDAWSSSQMDFSVTGNTGKITYDLNGNLLNMLHKGVQPGAATPITVDDMLYTYASYSNKLQSVTDQMTSTTLNGLFGDFKDGVNGANPDYVYDGNGNLVIDLNKNAKDLAGVTGANGIKYNYLDKPEFIRIAGKGTIQIIYSAAGEKLQRIFTPEPSGPAITTTYINQFLYQETAGGGNPTLQSINFEEGRIRVITPTSQGNGLDALIVDGNIDLPNSKRGAWDYFILDYQHNVRMILTEEVHSASNTATMEMNRATLEESIFGQAGAANEVSVTRHTPVPSGWTGNTSAYVIRLGTNSGHNTGPNTLQKVMAGDKVSATVKYYHQGSAGGNNSNFVSTVLGSLLQAITGGSAAGNLVKGNAATITTNLNGVTGFVNALQPGGSNPPGTIPQAFLTIIFFDERFNFVSAADGGVAQQQVLASVGSNGSTLDLSNIKAPKNGYAFVYISNQSNNDVFFDDLQIGITTGNIIEENHYYSFGLQISGISSKKLGDSYEGTLKNSYLYQGFYSELDGDIGWHDFALRDYDAQIGRFVQQDPYQQFASPYQGMGNDPINLVDPSGGETLPFFSLAITGLSTSAAKAITLAEVVLRSVSTITKSVSTVKTVLTIATVVLNVFEVSNTINSNIGTAQAGDRTLIHLRGMADAMFNANVLGIHDAIWGTNLGDYDDPYDQEAYLKGRIYGDGLVIAQGAVQVSNGLGGGGSLAIATGGTSVVVGGAVAAHGAAAAAVATKDIAWANNKLKQLNFSKTANSTENSVDPVNETTGTGRVKHKPSSDPPSFAKDAKWTKNPATHGNKWGWKDKNGNFITKGDKAGEWHVHPNPKTKNPKWQGEKPRRKSKQPYWNVKDDGTIHH